MIPITERAMPPLLSRETLEHFLIGWNHPIEKEMLQNYALEPVLIVRIERPERDRLSLFPGPKQRACRWAGP
jgi:hypothetical protein